MTIEMEHKGTRRIESSELSDKLRGLESAGVDVPRLYFSKSIPTYVGTEKDGVEVYELEGREIKVHAGEQIDSNGNVVNLRMLEAQIAIRIPDDNDYYTEKMDKVYDRILRPYTFPEFNKPTIRDYMK